MTTFEKYFNLNPLNSQKRGKGPTIQQSADYDNILKYNYTINQLKTAIKVLHIPECKKRKKKDIEKYTVNMMNIVNKICKIQKCWRNYFIFRFNQSVGPSFCNWSESNNIDDFYTAEDLHEISYYNFFSFKDSDGFIYTFNIVSIASLIDSKIYENPYNRKQFTPEIISLIKKRVRYNKILNKSDVFGEYKPVVLSFTDKVTNLFIKMDNLGNYTNVSWFLDLNIVRLKRFLYELFEIWNYRAQLTHQSKCVICPPNGNPFQNISLDTTFQRSSAYSLEDLRNIGFTIMERLVCSAINDSDKNTGVLYILCSLTLVSHQARNSLPWLYASTHYIN